MIFLKMLVIGAIVVLLLCIVICAVFGPRVAGLDFYEGGEQ